MNSYEKTEDGLCYCCEHPGRCKTIRHNCPGGCCNCCGEICKDCWQNEDLYPPEIEKLEINTQEDDLDNMEFATLQLFSLGNTEKYDDSINVEIRSGKIYAKSIFKDYNLRMLKFFENNILLQYDRTGWSVNEHFEHGKIYRLRKFPEDEDSEESEDSDDEEFEESNDYDSNQEICSNCKNKPMSRKNDNIKQTVCLNCLRVTYFTDPESKSETDKSDSDDENDNSVWIIFETYYKHKEFGVKTMYGKNELKEYLISEIRRYKEYISEETDENFECPKMPLYDLINQAVQLGNEYVQEEYGWGIRQILKLTSESDIGIEEFEA